MGPQRDRGPPPHVDVGRQRDRGPPPHGGDGRQRDQGPPPHGEDGCQKDRGPPSAGRMDRHGVGKLETGFIEEFADRVYGNVTDGYLHAGGGMVQSMMLDHCLTGCVDRH